MEMMSISDISINNKYLRTDTDVDSLMKSIEQIGLIAPLVVNKDNKLIAGGRRYSALKAMGWEEAPIVKIDEGDLKEELISIDENLVRKNLEDLELEHCLRRGKEIFEQLNPQAVEEITVEDLKRVPPKKLTEQQLNEELDNAFEELEENKTFVTKTAEKTGFTERQIKAAILRDRDTSTEVKKARTEGLIGTSHANELLKVDIVDQEKILPYIQEKASSVVRQIVKDVAEMGVDKAIEKTMTVNPLTSEFVKLKNDSKKLNRLTMKILAQEEMFEGPEKADAIKQAEILRDNLDEFIKMFS
jgi:ParB family chromosome partitioning protein